MNVLMLQQPAIERHQQLMRSVITLSKRGHLIAIRTVTPDDEEDLVRFLHSLSSQSVYLRYGSPQLSVQEAAVRQEAQRLVQRKGRHTVMIAQSEAGSEHPIVAVAELMRNVNQSAVAEIALVVADAYQRAGIGQLLAAQIVADAVQHGVTTLRATALAENTAIRRFIAGFGIPYRSAIHQGELTIEIDVHQEALRPARRGHHRIAAQMVVCI